MKKTMLGVLMLSCLVLFLIAACGKSEGGAAAAAGPPVEGSSCQGIGAMDSKMACDGQKILFCSSASQYKYAQSQVCGDDKKCVVAPDGKSASCQ